MLRLLLRRRLLVRLGLALLVVGLFAGVAYSAGPPTDIPGVPHYFGPSPNWANSPFTLPDVAVAITDPGGSGTGATAEATVGANGAVTGITITNPGSGYTAATVSFSGAGAGASAEATVTLSGVVTSVTVDDSGTGYSAPVVTFTGGSPTTTATATAYGSVEATLTVAGSGYEMPTVDFDLPDAPDGVAASGHAEWDTTTGAITAIVIDEPGSGYSAPPNMVIRDGTIFDPIAHDPGTWEPATATVTLSISSIAVDTFGAGYTSAPTVIISDPTGDGAGASATAFTDVGAVTGITLTGGGSGYITGGGIKKFTDALPEVCDPANTNSCPDWQTDPAAKYIPLAVPEAKVYDGIAADEYEIALVQYRTSFSSSMPGTLVRGYVQLETTATADISQHYPLTNASVDPDAPDTAIMIDGVQALGVTPPQFLGPIIAATKNKPVRIVFHNLLPTGAAGDLFLPTDSTLMGSGLGPEGMDPAVDDGTVLDTVRNPMCSQYPKDPDCYKDNRATLHLHGGITPWISDGTPHQWITPANEDTPYPEGVSVENVPDMDVGNLPEDGVQTFYYTNQQSARLMFYHDHAWGITRLNVYAGEAAGYLISDDTEKALLGSGTIPSDQIPLIIQDRTFVPSDAQLYGDPANGVYGQDPTWDKVRWGGEGNMWYHHVYMPAQNPGDPGGMSAFGRWMYGPWFWPPAANTVHGPIANPYYDPSCNLDDPASWQYDTDPFCEPEQIPGTPNISVGMEQFNDTPIVNGVAYPTITVEPKSYRLRMLNAANDRFFNFQWYVGDASTESTSTNMLGELIGPTEVALNPAEVAAAQLDPVVFPTPVQGAATAGPDWIQIGTEGGFLPAPVVVDGQQVTTWITDPTRFDVGNVDQHSLLLAPAERADVIVDFSKFEGQTLILYNDAPAAFPARVPSYDYYTGAPDLRPVGAPTILPGYGPNTRTVMQVKVAAAGAAPAFNLAKLIAAFKHNANGTGVFESGQHPIIVGQAAYNSAYGASFAGSGNCNSPGSSVQRCDGYVRVNDTSTFGFNTLRAPNTKTTMPLEPKAIHDEMNATTFDEFGRMQANLGVEAQPPVPGAQNVVLYPYVNPATELIDATNLPKNVVTYDTNGEPVSDVRITPISSATDGTQIWRITHNGVDTHPIHFHLYDVQLVNRVTWDNIIIPPDATELGWKDTVRIAPLEDTIVALRPIIPDVPWELPNSARPLHPAMPLGSTLGFNNVDANGNPTTPIVNSIVNFGWEYVYHCHILSHEEMDMMRPVSVMLPPNAPELLTPTYVGTGPQANRGVTLTWNDTSINETQFVVQRRENGGAWVNRGTPVLQPLEQDLPSGHGTRTFFDPGTLSSNSTYAYRVVAQNVVGYGNGFMQQTVQSVSNVMGEPTGVVSLSVAPVLPDGPGNQRRLRLDWTYAPSGDQTGFTIQRANNPAFSNPVTTIQVNSPSTLTYTNTGLSRNTTYYYRVRAKNAFGWSAWSSTVAATTRP